MRPVARDTFQLLLATMLVATARTELGGTSNPDVPVAFWGFAGDASENAMAASGPEARLVHARVADGKLTTGKGQSGMSFMSSTVISPALSQGWTIEVRPRQRVPSPIYFASPSYTHALLPLPTAATTTKSNEISDSDNPRSPFQFSPADNDTMMPSPLPSPLAMPDSTSIPIFSFILTVVFRAS